MQDAFRGRVPDSCLDWLTPELSAANWAKNFTSETSIDPGDYLFVAETEGEVIGLAMLTLITPDDGYDPEITHLYTHEIRSLHVDPAWQMQGVGRRLVSRVMEQLRVESANHLLVSVVAENPNLGFYERLGAVRMGTRPYDWEGYQTEQIIYGWDDFISYDYIGIVGQGFTKIPFREHTCRKR
jgi:ribosomal protein S18 acetylase RimI-like enzyme